MQQLTTENNLNPDLQTKILQSNVACHNTLAQTPKMFI